MSEEEKFLEEGEEEEEVGEEEEGEEGETEFDIKPNVIPPDNNPREEVIMIEHKEKKEVKKKLILEQDYDSDDEFNVNVDEFTQKEEQEEEGLKDSSFSGLHDFHEILEKHRFSEDDYLEWSKKMGVCISLLTKFSDAGIISKSAAPIVIICGRQSVGKSRLLSCLLGYPVGFSSPSAMCTLCPIIYNISSLSKDSPTDMIIEVSDNSGESVTFTDGKKIDQISHAIMLFQKKFQYKTELGAVFPKIASIFSGNKEEPMYNIKDPKSSKLFNMGVLFLDKKIYVNIKKKNLKTPSICFADLPGLFPKTDVLIERTQAEIAEQITVNYFKEYIVPRDSSAFVIFVDKVGEDYETSSFFFQAVVKKHLIGLDNSDGLEGYNGLITKKDLRKKSAVVLSFGEKLKQIIEQKKDELRDECKSWSEYWNYVVGYTWEQLGLSPGKTPRIFLHDLATGWHAGRIINMLTKEEKPMEEILEAYKSDNLDKVDVLRTMFETQDGKNFCSNYEGDKSVYMKNIGYNNIQLFINEIQARNAVKSFSIIQNICNSHEIGLREKVEKMEKMLSLGSFSTILDVLKAFFTVFESLHKRFMIGKASQTISWFEEKSGKMTSINANHTRKFFLHNKTSYKKDLDVCREIVKKFKDRFVVFPFKFTYDDEEEQQNGVNKKNKMSKKIKTMEENKKLEEKFCSRYISKFPSLFAGSLRIDRLIPEIFAKMMWIEVEEMKEVVVGANGAISISSNYDWLKNELSIASDSVFGEIEKYTTQRIASITYDVSCQVMRYIKKYKGTAFKSIFKNKLLMDFIEKMLEKKFYYDVKKKVTERINDISKRINNYVVVTNPMFFEMVPMLLHFESDHEIVVTKNSGTSDHKSKMEKLFVDEEGNVLDTMIEEVVINRDKNTKISFEDKENEKKWKKKKDKKTKKKKNSRSITSFDYLMGSRFLYKRLETKEQRSDMVVDVWSLQETPDTIKVPKKNCNDEKGKTEILKEMNYVFKRQFASRKFDFIRGLSAPINGISANFKNMFGEKKMYTLFKTELMIHVNEVMSKNKKDEKSFEQFEENEITGILKEFFKVKDVVLEMKNQLKTLKKRLETAQKNSSSFEKYTKLMKIMVKKGMFGPSFSIDLEKPTPKKKN